VGQRLAGSDWKQLLHVVEFKAGERHGADEDYRGAAAE
jgi:hypothetical protein